MAWTIMGSVGRWDRGARNDETDVTMVQTLPTSAAQVQGNPACVEASRAVPTPAPTLGLNPWRQNLPAPT